MKILQTDRLLLREFEESDAPFILDLLNSEGWLRYIGDRGVRDLAGAEGYLRKGPITSYRENGFGLWMVELLEGGIPVGMCGFINRDTLED
ncbi:MAG: GNAT family N-acetyltransferase, partial [Calditrichaeota bacterium]|nr:GNAT family N-acetyltransferase [Calditrichota bacterium]